MRELLLLQETAKKVNSILDLEKLLDEIVGGVAEAFGCNRTAVLLKDDARNDLEMVALRGFSNVHLKGYRFKVGGEGMVGHVSATVTWETRVCYGSKVSSRCLRSVKIFCGILASVELLKNGGRFTTFSKVPVPSDHKS